MVFDSESFTAGHTLIQRLEEYNPWWERGRNASVTGEYSSLRDGFRRSYEALHGQDDSLVCVTGPDGTGKTSLLKQLLSAHIDPDFVEKFIRDGNQREQAHENIVPPSNTLYIPLRADPVFQLHPEEQLRAAVDHFETHILREFQSPSHYIFLDDVHVVERPNKRGSNDIGRWERLIAELLANHDNRHIVISALSRESVRERLSTLESTVEPSVSPRKNINLYPMGFPDFLQMRHRDLELAPSADRFDEGAVRGAIQTAVMDEDHDSLVSELEAQQDAALVDASTARREIANYCTSGGLVTLRIAGNGVSLNQERFVDVIRGRDDIDFDGLQRRAIADFRDDLLRGATNLGGVKDATGLERFCALAAHELPTDDVDFTELIDVLNIDRRTLRNKYFSALSRLQLLSSEQEYDNQRPRKLRFYLRDPGLINAFCQNNLNDVLRREPGLNEALAKSVAFDHTIRLSNKLNNPHDPKRGVVKFWVGSEGTVDFIPKINGAPVPILWSYNRGLDELNRSMDTPGFDALLEFLEGDAYETEQDRVDQHMYNTIPSTFASQRREYAMDERYAGHLVKDKKAVVDGEPPFGMVLTNARSALEQGFSVLNTGSKPIIQIPLWTYLRLP